MPKGYKQSWPISVPKNGRVFLQKKKIVSKKNKRYPVGRFLHTGSKKGVEKEYVVCFAKIRDKKIRHTFL